MQFSLSIFTGNKFCLFNYATITTGGFVDVDWFRVNTSALTSDINEGNLYLKELPQNFFLGQNYPNPFNPTTKIIYQVPVTSNLNLKVFNLLGQEVATIYEGVRQVGKYEEIFYDKELASSVYFYRFQARSRNGTEQITVVKKNDSLEIISD